MLRSLCHVSPFLQRQQTDDCPWVNNCVGRDNHRVCVCVCLTITMQLRNRPLSVGEQLRRSRQPPRVQRLLRYNQLLDVPLCIPALVSRAVAR
jgi:hypothetical protein